jgi:hypothetical protein
MAFRVRFRFAGRSAALCMLGVVGLAASLTGCTAPGRPLSSSPPAASRSQSYPAPLGQAAVVDDNQICQLASDPAVPAGKRRSAAGECDALLRHSTVTKPAPSYTRRPPVQLSARDCASGQLSARFLGGGFGTGDDFGGIVLWNPGERPCRVHGPVTFAAYYADGSSDRKATVIRPITASPRTLPARMPAHRDGQDTGGYLVADLMGPERDDPAQPNWLCRPQDEGTPTSLELSIGALAVHVPNKDSGSPQNTSIFGCHGQVLLVDVAGPSS